MQRMFERTFALRPAAWSGLPVTGAVPASFYEQLSAVLIKLWRNQLPPVVVRKVKGLQVEPPACISSGECLGQKPVQHHGLRPCNLSSKSIGAQLSSLSTSTSCTGSGCLRCQHSIAMYAAAMQFASQPGTQ